MKSFLLALSLALALPAFAAEPVTTPTGVKLAKKKEKKVSPTATVPAKKATKAPTKK